MRKVTLPFALLTLAHKHSRTYRRGREVMPHGCRQLVDNIREADKDDNAGDVAEQSAIREQHASEVGVYHGSFVGAAVGEGARGDGEPDEGVPIEVDCRSLTDGMDGEIPFR